MEATDEPKQFSPWPFIVVGLLVANAALAFFALYMSRSDGGAQVIPDYYSRAVAWDSVAASQRATSSSGLTLRVTEAHRADSIVFVVTDASGMPVADVSGTVTIRRPHLTEAIGQFEVNGNPFSVAARFPGAGLFDAAADLTVSGVEFEPQIRFERRPGR